jgi:siroheme synthase-like protein
MVSKMAYFPFMMDIEDKTCLIVGGGKIAFHKAELLLSFGARIRLVAPKVCDEVKSLGVKPKSDMPIDGTTTGMAEIANVEIIKRRFTPEDLNNVDFVVAATDDTALGEYISGLCKKRGIPVNVVDKKEECSFIFPAIIKQGDLVVSVSTGGNSPAGAGYIKRQIGETLPDYYGDMVFRLGEYRDYILDNVQSPEDRKLIFNRLLEYGDSHGGDIPKNVVESFVAGKL